MPTINLPNSYNLRKVLERKRDYFKEKATELGRHAPSSWDRNAYALLSDIGIEYAVFRELLRKGRLNPDSLVRNLSSLTVKYNAPVNAKNACERVRGQVREKVRDLADYIVPVEGLDDEFMGFHDRGYEITIPFPKGCSLAGQDMVLQVDDLGRIRYAYPQEHTLDSPAPINYSGGIADNKELARNLFISSVDGWFSFPEIGRVETNDIGQANLEKLAKGDRLAVGPRLESGFYGIVKEVERTFHSPDNVSMYLSNLRKSSYGRVSPFAKLLDGMQKPSILSEQEINDLLDSMKKPGD